MKIYINPGHMPGVDSGLSTKNTGSLKRVS